ncbi:MAG: hypothetical protein ACREPS_04950 [Rhodanobacteraceae bacterium]
MENTVKTITYKGSPGWRIKTDVGKPYEFDRGASYCINENNGLMLGTPYALRSDEKIFHPDLAQGDPPMKLRLVFPVLAAVVLAFTASNAYAYMRWDPTTGATAVPVYTLGQSLTNIESQACGDKGFPTDFASLTSCFAFNNLTNSPVSSFGFSFTASSNGMLTCQQLMEKGSTPAFGESNCPLNMVAGDPVNILLSGIPAWADDTDLIIGFSFDVPMGSGTPDPVPEPGELGMFGLGLLVIGVGYGWDKRHRGWKNKSAG